MGERRRRYLSGTMYEARLLKFGEWIAWAVRLRLVGVHRLVWTVNVKVRGGGGTSIRELGLVGDDPEADWEAHRKTAERLAEKCGYMLPAVE